MSNSCPTSIAPPGNTPARKNDKRSSEWSSPLVRELAIVLATKFIVLFALWFAFFRAPVDADLTSHTVSQAVFGSATTPDTTRFTESLHGQ